MGLHLLIALGIVGRFSEVAVERCAIHLHGERTDVPDLRQLHFLRLLREDSLLLIGHIELWIDHSLFLVDECMLHPFPGVPLAHRLVDISQSCPLVRAGYLLISQHGQLTSLWQILIDLDHRVELLCFGILVHLTGCDTGSPAIAHLIIIGMDILETAIEFIGNHTQHIIVEDICIDAFLHEGVIGLVLHLCQLLTELWCQHWRLDVEPQSMILLTDLIEHRLIDRLQHHVASSLIARNDALHFRFQRVGRNLSHHLGSQQFCLQQLSVVLTLCSLLHDPLQHLILGLWQVFLRGLCHFLPKGSIRLSKYKQWHHQCDQ